MKDGEIVINGITTSYTKFGAAMGEGFLDALSEPLTPKAYIENSSRLEDGKRVVVGTVRFESRTLNLDFTITGSSEADFKAKKKAFLAEMYKGEVSINVPILGETYHLTYKGKGSTYALSPARNFCHMVLKFEEPNPSDRV